MSSWIELEKRFLEVEPALRFARLDVQTGTKGEYWRLAALTDNVGRFRFQSLSSLGGRKLREAVAPREMGDLLDGSPDDRTVWYRLLARNRRFYTPGSVVYPVDDKGERRGWIAFGHINDPAGVAAAKCRELSSAMPEATASAARMNLHISGHNARVNKGGIDNSTNVMGGVHYTQIFDGLRKAINEGVPIDRREEILKKVNEMEATVHTPEYLQRYREFMQVLADHVTVAMPFLASLAALLE
jgi:hypothetical protein